MKIETLLIAGGMIALGVMYSKKTTAATAPKATAVPVRLANAGQNTSGNGMLLFGTAANALGKLLGANWAVQPGSTTTIDYTTQGNAIGNYAGMTQDQANQQSVTDYNNQFISPWGASDFAWVN